MIGKMNEGFLTRCRTALAVVSIFAPATPGMSEPLSTPLPAVDRPKILCVSRSLEGRKFIEAALAAQDVETRVGGPEIMPETLKELVSYDCVVLSNIPRSSLGDGKMRMLVRYVRDYGGGLVVLGGPGSIGPAYRGTPVEEILPVTMGGGTRFGKEEALPLCIILLIDKSGSTGEGFGGTLSAARKSVEELVKNLRSDDMLGIIPFDALYKDLVPLAPLGNDRQGIIDRVRGIETGGGSVLSKPLEEALRQMEGSSCRVKHVILVTGGQARDLSMYDYRGLIARFARSGISISAIGVGSDADNDFLRAIAVGTRGGYSHVKDEAALSLTVLRDARRAMMESGFAHETVVPKLGEKSPMLKGIRRDELPELTGYMIVTAKPGADVALYADVRGGKDPLLAAWRRGYGKAVIWTSDVEGNWSGGAGSVKKTGKFWARLMRWAMQGRPGSR